MPSGKAIIAAAGGGKTTRIVSTVLAQPQERAALLTFTRENTEEILRKIYERTACIPPHVEVMSWYSFLLKEMVRPYRSFLYGRRVDGMVWCNSQSTRGIAAADVSRFHFTKEGLIYSDKVSHFAHACNKASRGLVIDRIEQRFDHIYIDEIQDMAGYDLEVIELLLKSKVKVTMVGDFRQGTYSTHNTTKNRKFRQNGIIHQIERWKTARLLDLVYETETYRCNPAIAAFADSLFPDVPKTLSSNKEITGHDGVFVIRSAEVEDYARSFKPQVLRYSRTTDCRGFDDQALNFGVCKGRTYDRVMIFPNGKASSWLKTGDYVHIEKSLAEMYVGITRARFSVAFVFDKDSPIDHLTLYRV